MYSALPPVPKPSHPPTTVPGALRLANRLAMAGLAVPDDEADTLFLESGRALALAWALSREETCAANLEWLGPSTR